MDKTLQTTAWNCLPKEFKEEVKYEYHRAATKATKDEYDLGFMHAHEGMFGIHNLTSDAEGEEMLYANKSKVQKIFAGQTEVQKSTPCGTILHHEAAAKAELLYTLFGSKCLPDEVAKEPTAAEPKFKVGDYVRYKGGVHKVVATAKDNRCYLNKILGCIDESDLEPYTEQTDLNKSPETCTDDCPSQSKSQDHFPDPAKMVDNIIKDGFRNERRLNIAVQMVKTLTQSSEIVDRISSACDDSLLDGILYDALYLTDKLIAECEKGGEE